MHRTGIRPKVNGVEVDVPLAGFVGGQYLRYTGTEIDTAPGGGGGGIVGPGSTTVGNVVTWNDITGTTVADAGFLATDVVRGPASATNGRVAVYNGATGKLIQNGTKLESDLVTGPASSGAFNIALFGNTSGKVLADSFIGYLRLVLDFNLGANTVGNLPMYQAAGSPANIRDSGVAAASVVVGPASAVNGNLASYNGITGKLIQDSGIAVASINTQPALIVNTTWYCNSATGNDTTGDGSIGNPWQTLPRAWTERNKYGQIKANLRIICQGTGIYDGSGLGPSVCGTGGTLSIEGDAITSHLIGTFSGPKTGTAAGSTIPSATALGADTHRGRLCRVTSGLAVGWIFQIGEHTNTAMTPVNAGNSLPTIAPGDGFEIYSPNTALNNPTITDWSGGGVNPQDLNSTHPAHYIYNVRTTGSTFVTSSTVGMAAVRLGAGFRVASTDMRSGMFDSTRLGIGTGTTQMLSGCGIYGDSLGSTVAIDFDAGTLFFGPISQISANPTFRVGFTAPATAILSGCRLAGFPTVFSGTMSLYFGTTYVRFSRTLLVEAPGILQQGSSAPGTGGMLNITATAGDALLCKGLASFPTPGLISGGTTAGAGYGSRVSGPGKVIWGGGPTLTGGTAGLDLKTDNTAGAANATLAAAGNAQFDTINGGVIARV